MAAGGKGECRAELEAVGQKRGTGSPFGSRQAERHVVDKLEKPLGNSMVFPMQMRRGPNPSPALALGDVFGMPKARNVDGLPIFRVEPLAGDLCKGLELCAHVVSKGIDDVGG